MASRLDLPSPFLPTIPTRSPSFSPSVTESKTTFVGNSRCRASAPRRCAISTSRLGHRAAGQAAASGAAVRRRSAAALLVGRVERDQQSPQQVGQHRPLVVVEGREQGPLAVEEVGQGGVDDRPAPLGQSDQDAAPVARVGRARGRPRPAEASRSIRLVMVPEVTRVARSSAPGVSWNGGPARRRADSTSNSHDSRSCAAKAPRRAMSRCLASRETRLQDLQRGHVEIRPLLPPGRDQVIDLIARRGGRPGRPR